MYMICEYILLITFLNKTKLFFCTQFGLMSTVFANGPGNKGSVTG